jgi:hypothetical protein
MQALPHELLRYRLANNCQRVAGDAVDAHVHHSRNAISVLVGVHRVLTQVPPKRCLSIIATDFPASANRAASEGPAWPAPMTIASYC